MTDKQIIIDDQKKTIHRLQQECTEKTNIIIALGNKLQAKEQECEGLTSKCSQLEEEIKDWQKEVERIQFIGSYGIMDEVKKNTKLEQTLTEIKEIAETCSFTDNDELLLSRLEQILQKISECEGNDE